MTAEINAIIEKNLPAQVGELLKKRLEQADKDASDLKITIHNLECERKKTITLEEVINKYKNFDERNVKLVERENIVAEKERNQKVFEAELKATAAEARAVEMAGFVGMVFKSPVFRSSVYGSKSVQNGQYGTMSHPFNKTTEIQEQ